MNSLGGVVDLFSGGGGMSYGFAAHPLFDVVGAADVEVGKPSTGHGAIACNLTYAANMGVQPLDVDLGVIDPDALLQLWESPSAHRPTVLLACPPCTGFSRAVAKNHTEDDVRNGLVGRVAEFAEALKPKLIFMENVPQLLNGSFSQHCKSLKRRLEDQGYQVHAQVHRLRDCGLPQQRERALIIAAAEGIELRTLEDLWDGYSVSSEATTVRRAIAGLPRIESGQSDPIDPAHTSTGMTGLSLERMRATPVDGGSWSDLYADPDLHQYMIPSMWSAVEKKRLNSYSDIYGRMAWDKPAPTIKRECSHMGNGRYGHPEQDRMCTVRELAVLQGFPRDYVFEGTSRKNLYRQVGDAVPPLVSHQLSWLASWMLTDDKPDLADAILPGTSLTAADLKPAATQRSMVFV